jgi:hypothetical protein
MVAGMFVVLANIRAVRGEVYAEKLSLLQLMMLRMVVARLVHAV